MATTNTNRSNSPATTTKTSMMKDKQGVSVEVVTVTKEGSPTAGEAHPAGGPRSCVFSTNLRDQPPIVAVSCAPDVVNDVRQCLEYVANFQANSQMVVPHRFRFTLRMDGRNQTAAASSYCYFSCLQVTDPEKLDRLYHGHMGLGVRPASVDKVLLLMPLFDNHSGTSNSGSFALPPAPDAKVRMRDHIKQVLEDRCASPNGWIRTTVDGGGGAANPNQKKRRRIITKSKSTTKKQPIATSKERVKLCDALRHMEDWKVDWGASSHPGDGSEEDQDLALKPREIQYLKKHVSHFLEMAIDGVSSERAIKYVEQVCSQPNE